VARECGSSGTVVEKGEHAVTVGREREREGRGESKSEKLTTW
jgi:hypothetical protein